MATTSHHTSPSAHAGRAARCRSPWEDRFRRPSADDLRGHYTTRALAHLAETAREELASLPGVAESIEWQGVPWRWTWVYRSKGQAMPLAYLVPDPEHPQIAAPLSAAMVETIGLARLKRYARDGIAVSRQVAGVHWPSWEITLKSQLDEVMDLVERKQRAMAGARETVRGVA